MAHHGCCGAAPSPPPPGSRPRSNVFHKCPQLWPKCGCCGLGVAAGRPPEVSSLRAVRKTPGRGSILFHRSPRFGKRFPSCEHLLSARRLCSSRAYAKQPVHSTGDCVETYQKTFPRNSLLISLNKIVTNTYGERGQTGTGARRRLCLVAGTVEGQHTGHWRRCSSNVEEDRCQRRGAGNSGFQGSSLSL